MFFFQVLDFLFLVGELEEKGYNGDSAEMALLTHDKDITKVTIVSIIIIVTVLEKKWSLSIHIMGHGDRRGGLNNEQSN